MALQRFKVALNSARFPLVSTKGSRAVFTPGLDSAPRTPRTFMGTEVSADYNTAQILYGENIIPLAEGYCSVNYEQKIAASVNTDFTNIFPLRDELENVVLYSPSGGKNYIYEPVGGAWTSSTHAEIFTLTLSAGSIPADARVSYAYVEGYTFVCYSRLKSTTSVDMSIMWWDAAAKELKPATTLVTNLPFAVGEIDGIAASNGYLIVWSGIEIAWAPFSGTSSAFDFTPYANGTYTGAGTQIPEDVKGNFRAIIGVSGGFIAFTDNNAVAGNYHAQNLVAPWLFREISGAGGIDTYEQATVEGSLGVVYAYTTAGFQKITLNSSELLHTQLADFITGRQYEFFDSVQRSLTLVNSQQDLAIKVTNIANRYVAISYGLVKNVYDFVLIYDLGLERWGKLKVTHSDCFYYAYAPTSANLTYAGASAISYDSMSATPYSDLSADATADLIAAPHALGLLSSTGKITVASWDTVPTIDSGVLIIGRVQLTRARNTQINRLEIEGLNSGIVTILPSYDGRNLATPVEVFQIISDSGMYVGGTMVDCRNFNLLIQGSFDLSTVIVEAVPTGQF